MIWRNGVFLCHLTCQTPPFVSNGKKKFVFFKATIRKKMDQSNDLKLSLWQFFNQPMKTHILFENQNMLIKKYS